METTESMQDLKPKVYELGYLLAPTIAEEQLAGEVQNIKSVLEKFETLMVTEDFPKLRPLAYTMVKAVSGQRLKFDKAYFGWMKFEVNTNAIPLIKAELDKNDKIIRFMLIRTVRENTMFTQRMAFRGQAELDKKRDGETSNEPKMTEEEIDKTIENLVVE